MKTNQTTSPQQTAHLPLKKNCHNTTKPNPNMFPSGKLPTNSSFQKMEGLVRITHSTEGIQNQIVLR